MRTSILLSLFIALVLGTACSPKTKNNRNTFNRHFSVHPPSLHPFNSSDTYASYVQGYVLDTLMERDPDTYGWRPRVATHYKKDPKGRFYTFFLRKNARFTDGKPVTAHDFKFAFEAVFNTKRFPKAARIIPYYENISRAEALDDHTIRFYVKKSYFGNFSTMAGLEAIPKHFYDNDKKLNKTILGSGPYKFKKQVQGQYISLVKNKDWWGWEAPSQKGNINPMSCCSM